TAMQSPIEGLEDRRLLSAASFSGGVLSLTGDPSSPNQFSIAQTRPGYIGGNVNGKTAGGPASAVHAIRISGGNARDVLYINPALNIPALIRTFGGDDL